MPAGPHAVEIFYTSNAISCYSLSLDFDGSGTAPTALPARSSGCPNGKYVAGEVIQLTAHPAGGYSVSGWDGTDDDSLTTTANTVTMPSTSHIVTVTYRARILIPLIVVIDW
jgi:hypothetical protein